MTGQTVRVAVIAVGLLTASAAATAAAVSLNVREESESPVPEYVDDSGQLVLDKVPDMVPVASRGDGEVVGFSFKEDVYPEQFRPELLANVEPGGLPAELEAPIPVFATAVGVKLVGHVHTDIGYVSLTEASEPGFTLDDLRISPQDVESFDK